MNEELKIPSLEYVSKLFQEQQKKVYLDWMSQISEDGIQFAASVLYAQYLGMYIIGPIPAWIRRVKVMPLMSPDELLYGIRYILKTKGVTLTDQGELKAL